MTAGFLRSQLGECGLGTKMTHRHSKFHAACNILQSCWQEFRTGKRYLRLPTHEKGWVGVGAYQPHRVPEGKALERPMEVIHGGPVAHVCSQCSAPGRGGPRLLRQGQTASIRRSGVRACVHLCMYVCAHAHVIAFLWHFWRSCLYCIHTYPGWHRFVFCIQAGESSARMANVFPRWRKVCVGHHPGRGGSVHQPGTYATDRPALPATHQRQGPPAAC